MTKSSASSGCRRVTASRAILPRCFEFIVLVLLFACGRAESRELSRPPGTRVIYVLSNNFHSGVALSRRDVRGELSDVVAEFPKSDFLLLGWGEDDYYRAKNVSVWTFLKAVFSVNRSVIQVIGVKGPVERFFDHSEIVAVSVSESGLAGLRRYLANEFQRDREGRIIPLGAGFHPDSEFYAGSHKYFLPKTCNVWTAGALRAAGVRVNSTFALTADDLMWRVLPRGRRVQTLKKPVDAF